jgi:hypothetical protein
MIRIFICLLVSLSIYATASTTRADVNDPKMPGHEIKERNLINSKVDVVIGKFISLGNLGDDNLGASYERAEIQITNSLQGPLLGNIKVSYAVRSFPLEHKEIVPALNTEYILFIRDQKIASDNYELVKILPATDTNITRIKALIAQSSK